MNPALDDTDRTIVNALQGGFPLVPRPFAVVAASLGLDEDDLIERVRRLVGNGVLSRFGPLFQAERLGGAVTLAAMAVPEARFDAVAEMVGAFPEVAHNYQREHTLNMWFVVAAETPAGLAETLTRIGVLTGLAVHNFPRLAEYYIGLRLDA
ncbi:MAG: AsnC family transcriptional regulator [Alphaproteobacteria bacterium]|nr:AsnC family transcriptional regulator [Alphaproteobacteria bacterium]